ncbi:Holliday junction resolvase RuvX [Leifsonia sp. ku-ls]|nr:Holliday junction resolvase RuvX [Leifsonia sp. ku-ls]
MRVGIDVGKVRIGVSRSDLHGMLATPVETVSRSEDAADRRRIAEIVGELGAFEIIVGLPLALSGARTASTADAIGFAEALASEVDVPVRMVDERLSTVSATSALRASGRNTKKARPVVDQVAATIILQHALDAERATGRPPGDTVESSIGP